MNTTEHVTNSGQGTTRIPNKLIDEKSPYLLQHAYNPVIGAMLGYSAKRDNVVIHKKTIIALGPYYIFYY